MTFDTQTCPRYGQDVTPYQKMKFSMSVMIPYIYKVNFKFSLSSIFYIEEMLTIICNSSNGLYFVYLFAVDHSFHCNLDLETCPDLETCLELVLLPNYIDLSYKQ